MILPVICFVGGLVAMGRTKPQTAVRKLICLGPRSGIVYPVEDFQEIGTVVVRAPGSRAVAQFIRAAVREPGRPGLIYQHGQGDPQLLELIRRDFGVEPQKPVAATGAGSGKQEAGSPEGPSDPSSAPRTPHPAPKAPKSQNVGRSTP